MRCAAWITVAAAMPWGVMAMADALPAKLDGIGRMALRPVAADDRWHDLPNMNALDAPEAVEIATALATCGGPLSLPGLEGISPQTLSALLTIEKPGHSITPGKPGAQATGSA